MIIKLQGGLGNQMFQYAFAYILAKKNKDIITIDKSFFERVEKKSGFTPRKFELDIFNHNFTKASKIDLLSFQHLSIFNKVKKKLGFNYPKIYNETSFGFQQSALNLKSPIHISGYFQSYEYYIGYEKLIKKIFSFSIDKLDQVNKELNLTIKGKNTIAIHIRRGDYVNDEITEQYHGSCSLEYYLEGIKLLASEKKEYTLVFFSDDSVWVKKQFENLPYSKIFIDYNTNENSWKDMFLMSSCNHNIIANSSFSWWAAWLNENPEKKVIAPKEWFKAKKIDIQTLLPTEWIKL
nr:alpha-1,2-fucosyltransferase [Flavobacterium gawalongense]